MNIKKLVITILSILSFVQGQAQLIEYFNLPERFKGRNVDTSYWGYSKGSFFELQDSIYYINHYNFPSGTDYFIFKLSGKDLVPYDSFNANYDNGLAISLGHEPQVVVYKDTLFINTKKELHKWTAATKTLIKDTGLNTNGELIDVLALTPEGNPIVSFFEGMFGIYDSTGWKLRQEFYGTGVYPEARLFDIQFKGDTLLILTTEDLYMLKNWQKVDSVVRFHIVNGGKWLFWPRAMHVGNGALYHHMGTYYVFELRNNTYTPYGKDPKDRIYTCRDLEWHKGLLWATAIRTWNDSLATLHYYLQNRWHDVGEDHIQWLYNIRGRMYVDGERPGVVADFALVNGQVRFDDGNCIVDAGDEPLFTKIEVGGTSKVYFSNDGYFTFPGIQGKTYTIKSQKHHLAKGYLCGTDSIVINIQNKDSSYTVDIAQEIDTTIHDISVGIGTAAAVKGQYVIGAIRIKNENKVWYDSIRIQLKFDSRLSQFTSDSGYSRSGDSVLFTLYTVKGYEERHIPFSMYVDTATLDTGGILVFSTRLLTIDSFTSNNQDTIVKTVVRPFDPNMKESYPSGRITQKVEKIDYTIHFQNIGSSPAINVTVVDTLDTSLPVEYIRIKATSHPQTYQLKVKDNILVWTFKGINLPDSSTDEPGSKGFISYEARVSDGLNRAGDRIDNRAFIYFDYEEPVITNIAAVYLEDSFSRVELVGKDRSGHQIEVYPNPFGQSLTIKNTSPGTQLIMMYDSNGKLLKQIKLDRGTSALIDTAEQPAGMYYLKTVGSRGVKLVKF
ncbi:MAG: T9SS type A sorting domain-containing protein [Flavobacteriales bacterium]|nr:T9SS type A sorting domain-containing protein [Flavobacteriales bacterium]